MQKYHQVPTRQRLIIGLTYISLVLLTGMLQLPCTAQPLFQGPYLTSSFRSKYIKRLVSMLAPLNNQKRNRI